MANPFDVALTNLNSLYSGIPDVPVLQTYNSLNPYDISLTNLNNLSNFIIEPALLPEAAGTYGPTLGQLAFAVGGGILSGVLANELGIENEILITKFLSFWTPGSDYALGQDYIEFIGGREGFDTIIGYDPGLNSAFAPVQIDFTIAGPSLVNPFAPLNEPARYVLGDWRKPYYVDNNIYSEGLSDFMYVSIISFNPVDFSPQNNRLQLHGSLNDYYFVATDVVIDLSSLAPGQPPIIFPGTEIYYKTGQVFADLIAVVPFQDPTDPNLISAWIDFEGYTPPELADLNPLTSTSYQETAALFLSSPLLQLGYEGIDIGGATALAPDGDIYVAGSTSSLLGPFPRGGSDNFIARYNDDGSLEWIVQFGSTEFDILTDIVSDAAGNVYATGWTRGNVETGSGLAPGVQDNWVAKFDASGNQLWVEQFTIDGYLDRSMGIALDGTSGTVYLTGHSNTDGTVADTDNPGGFNPIGTVVTWIASFDANTGAENYRNIFEVSITNNDGGVPGEPGLFDEGFGVAVDNSGNLFATGWAGENAYDVYLTKFDTTTDPSTSTELWSKSFGTGSNATQSYSWDVASDGTNAYVLGWTQDTLDKFRDQGTGLYSDLTQSQPVISSYNGGAFDAYIAAFTDQGVLSWITYIGGNGDDGTFMGKIVADGDFVYATGYTNGFIGTLDQEGSNAGDYDAWIGKFDKLTGETAWIQQIGSTKLDYATGISIDGDDIFVTGFTEGSLGGLNGGASDAWVAKLNQAGALEAFNVSAPIAPPAPFAPPAPPAPPAPDLSGLQLQSLGSTPQPTYPALGDSYGTNPFGTQPTYDLSAMYQNAYYGGFGGYSGYGY
ncbi:hypothetical protein IQ225_11280 [Synechocystis salina LEGE 06155]|uniref:Haemolysin-type calcium-binding repeat n=1 Tax=Synechocystis salina LEGE 06155 TaxID=945782 RepID=A0A0K1SB48_9SYNC|nr:haemolysin-type calcium-binding repeat [Synechocystis salina LEGE 06155]MBE9175736.1 hypothetical protein [Synechocystis salina LEGE 06155]